MPNLFRMVAWTLALSLTLSGCAPEPIIPPSAAPATAPAAMVTYGRSVVMQVQNDWVLQRLIFSLHLPSVLLYRIDIAEDGTVHGSKVIQGSAPLPAEQAISDRLLQERFSAMPVGTGFHATSLVVDFRPVAPVGLGGVILYQPQQMLVARIGGARPLADYIGQIMDKVRDEVAVMPPATGATVTLVIGVKPGNQSRAWLVTQPGALPPGVESQLVAAAESVPALSVSDGPVAFGLNLILWGGGPPVTDASHPAPFPQAWTSGAPPGPELVPDGIFARIWP